MKFANYLTKLASAARVEEATKAREWIISYRENFLNAKLEELAKEGKNFYSCSKISLTEVQRKELYKNLRNDGFKIDERPRDLAYFTISWY